MELRFPSIAVFVPEKDKVEAVAAEIRAALAETNIDVEACVKGQVLDQVGAWSGRACSRLRSRTQQRVRV